MKAQNNFAITGFIASDAKVTDFGKAQKVRFGIRVTTVQKDKDGNERKETAIINAETIVKKDDTAKMELLKKGSFVTTTGFFKPEEIGRASCRERV
mgnify:CR=1 FL=1